VKPESARLLTKGRASLEAAKLLNGEGFHDFAASRAYYAMFYCAEALLLERGLSFSSHSAVIAAFGRELAAPGELDPKLHRWLIDAQDLRNLGDYGVGPSLTAVEAGQVLVWAKGFLDECERALSP
jgi:uncharacterized protein (UPF0332 family)